MGQLTGADGKACLLRAMCETSSMPLHDEGILGDAVNFLLTANYASEETDENFKEYLEAQTNGQVNKLIDKNIKNQIWSFQLKGECSEFHKKCPMSFFKLLEINFL